MTDLARILQAGYRGLCSTPDCGANSSASYQAAAAEGCRIVRERLDALFARRGYVTVGDVRAVLEEVIAGLEGQS